MKKKKRKKEQERAGMPAAPSHTAIELSLRSLNEALR